jgi:diguanylate cyclase (GGDEF)-like protein
LHIKRAAFFLKREGSGDFALTSQRGLVDEKTITLRESHPLIQWFSTHDSVLMSNALQVLPQFKAMWGRERQELVRIGAEFYIPLKSKNELVGIFAVGPKQSEEPYSQDDQLTLTTLANQTAVAIENARLFNNEAIRRQEAETWSNVLAKLTSALDIEHVLESTLMHIREVIPYDRAQVYLLVNHNNKLRVERIWTVSGEDPLMVSSEESGLFYNPSRHNEQHLNNGDIEHSDVSNINLNLPAKIKHLIESAKPLIIPDKTSRPAWFKKNYATGSWIGAPIIVHLNIFAGQTSLALQNASLFHEVQQLAITDDLTGILNRRNLFEMGESALIRAQRFDSNLSLIMLDLDNLKYINDNFGHIVGDQALRFVAKRYKNSLRDIDIFGRYGGDEFVIILPQTNLSNATLLAERLCLMLKENPLIVNDDLVPVTASFGVAIYDHDTHDLAALIHQADLAMYNAKHSGRDQIFVNASDLDSNSIETVDS